MAKTLAALIVSLCIAFSAAAAQSKPEAKKAPRPAWTELTAAQQQVLAPLQAEWEALDTTRRRKWVDIANRYPTMKQAQQARLQKRMQEWSKLTPEERRVAREQYRTLKKIPPKQRKEKWKEYQQSVAPAEAPPAAPPETPTGAN